MHAGTFDIPAFDELPSLEPGAIRHAWDVLDHDLGTVGLRTPEAVVAAAGLVTDGSVYPLGLPIDEPAPPLFGRDRVEHTVFATDRNTLDDRLDAFHPQGSSQWDGLRHVRAREHGFFGGHVEEFPAGAGPLGIEHWARTGIVGRGVLLDLVVYYARTGTPYDPLGGHAISAQDLAAAAAAQGVTLQRADIVCVRTGWIDAYRALDAAGRAELARQPRASGLSGAEDVARLLWNAQISAIAADNPTLEVAPGDPAAGSLHRRLIPALGFAVGELLDLGPLAAACAADGRWTFLFVGVPLNIPGGIGSPANTVAIR